MRRVSIAVIVLALLPAIASAELQVVVIEGIGGELRYTEDFARQVAALGDAVAGLTSADRIRAFRTGDFTREEVIDYFETLGSRLQSDDRLAIFLIGHGSYDDHEYKFNIAGPDLTDNDLLDILGGVSAGSLLLVNTSSSSGATVDRLKGDNRTLILATRSGAERHATRFGSYFAAALTEPTADIDKNHLVSAEEAYRFAERQVTDFFERNGQLATEHSRFEGDQGARFSLARLGDARPAQSDPELDRLVAERDRLNSDIEGLRIRRDSMAPDQYQAELLEKMLELAILEEEIERHEEGMSNE